MATTTLSRRIRACLQEGEDILTSLLGLIIAISGLIAFADVFSSGKALSFMPWLLWVWIIAQAIAVDYQFFTTVKRQFTASNPQPLVYWIRWSLIAVLGLLVVVIGAIFAVQEAKGGTTDAAMTFLGIPLIAFMYARAASPVLLLFVIAVDHALDRDAAQPTMEVAAPAITPDVLNVLIERLDHLTVTVTQLSTTTPAQAQMALPEPNNDQDAKMPFASLPERSDTLKSLESGLSEPGERSETAADTSPKSPLFESKEAAVNAVLARMPNATLEDVMREAGCTEKTAQKWMDKLAN